MLRKSGGALEEGEIIAGDKDNVYLRTFRGEEAVPKKDIVDIDHPGNGLAVAGAVLSAYGVLNILVGAAQCGDKPAAFCVGVFLPAGVGIPMAITGLAIWNRSTSNVNKPKSTAFQGMYLSPNYAYHESGATYGFSLTKGF